MSEPMTEWNRSALICLRGDLNLNVNLKGSGMLPMLAIESPQGFLNQYEMRNIKALSNEMDQMDKIIDFLLGKEDNCFSKFCDSLIKSGNRTWGEQLKMKAEEFKRGSDSPAAGGSAASDILSQKVYEHPEHLSLMRKNVSRAAGTQWKAVLEELGLEEATITSCFQNNPMNFEEAVQSGLVKWSGGHAKKSPTWSVLLKAMDEAGIHEKYTENLKRSLGLSV